MTAQKDSFKKARKIRVTQSTDRGRIYSPKNVADRFVEFESLGEEALFLLLDHDPNCTEVESQPVKVPNPTKKGVFYVPDAWAKFRDGTEYLFDVKFHTFFEELPVDPEEEANWKERLRCIKDFCKDRGLCHEVVTDYELRTERFENVLFFRKNKREPTLLAQVRPVVLDILSISGGLPRLGLAKSVSAALQVDFNEIIPCVDHLIFLDCFDLDFESRITDDTVLKIKPRQDGTSVLPLHQYFAKIRGRPPPATPPVLKLSVNGGDLNGDSKNPQEFLALPERVQQEVLGKIKHLEIFANSHFSSELLQEYACQHNVAACTLYRWKKAFNKEGWAGLIPHNEKKGRKKGKNAQLEKIMQDVIEARYLTKLQPSVGGCYRYLVVECKKAGIKPCHLDTFRRRVQSLSPKLKTAKRRGHQPCKNGFRLLNGVFPFGLHPLDAIEIDHTILDIILVSRDRELPIGRPAITVAIDAFSRMIFGYYLSFDAPSSLSVGMCLYVGIMPKDGIAQKAQAKHDWPICGVPKRIICDNGKEFGGQALYTFCQQYDVEVIFNPVHSPEKKPHIERFFRTLNLAIRDDLIGGYVPPIAQKRAGQYDPQKYATMTFDEFERWLVHWVVDDYHQKIHEGIKEQEGIDITPHARFQQGILSSGGRAVGVPFLPPNTDQLKFDVLPFEKRQISRGGTSILGLKYNAPIIGQLIALPQSPREKYIIRYDPRDIREVYAWVPTMKRYVEIPLKNVYWPQLKVHPTDPADSPLSLQELNAIKRNRPHLFPVNQQELAEACDARQKIVDDAKVQTRAAKSRRKHGEIARARGKRATSASVRERAQGVPPARGGEREDCNHPPALYPIIPNWDEGDLD